MKFRFPVISHDVIDSHQVHRNFWPQAEAICATAAGAVAGSIIACVATFGFGCPAAVAAAAALAASCSSLAVLAAQWFFSGPFGFDHAEKPDPNSSRCKDYLGRPNMPFCYGGHKGTDFALIGDPVSSFFGSGKFAQMDLRDTNWVVAAADGYVTEVRDGGFDRCKAELRSEDLNKFFAPDCQGKTWADGTKVINRENRITICHGDTAEACRDGRGIETWYLHIKKGSAKVGVGDWVSCGQKIAEIGSSGYSSAPHLHFEVRDKSLPDNGQAVDPFQGPNSQDYSYWEKQSDGPKGLPGTRCQNPEERYGKEYDAKVEIVSVRDLGTLSAPPSGLQGTGISFPARWYEVQAAVSKKETLIGFLPQNVKVLFTYPKTAKYIASAPTEETSRYVTKFYIPIAPLRDPKLSDYEFNLVAKVWQTQPVEKNITRFVRVRIPRPKVEIKFRRPSVRYAQSTEKCEAPSPTFTAVGVGNPSGLSGSVSDLKWRWRTEIRLRGKPDPLRIVSDPTIHLCRNEVADVRVDVSDPSGVEGADAYAQVSAPLLGVAIEVRREGEKEAMVELPIRMVGSALESKAVVHKIAERVRLVAKPIEFCETPWCEELFNPKSRFQPPTKPVVLERISGFPTGIPAIPSLGRIVLRRSIPTAVAALPLGPSLEPVTFTWGAPALSSERTSGKWVRAGSGLATVVPSSVYTIASRLQALLVQGPSCAPQSEVPSTASRAAPVSGSTPIASLRGRSAAMLAVAPVLADATYSFENTTRPGDTLVLRFSDLSKPINFSACLVAKDAWGRDAKGWMEGSSGIFVPLREMEMDLSVLAAFKASGGIIGEISKEWLMPRLQKWIRGESRNPFFAGIMPGPRIVNPLPREIVSTLWQAAKVNRTNLTLVLPYARKLQDAVRGLDAARLSPAQPVRSLPVRIPASLYEALRKASQSTPPESVPQRVKIPVPR